jgi:serine/threonine protein kinase
VAAFTTIEHGAKIAAIPSSYCGGRYEFVSELALGGQGYALLVKDTWSGGSVVLKGLWWTMAELRDSGQARFKQASDAQSMEGGVRAVATVGQRSQQVPQIIDYFWETSPTRIAFDALVDGDDELNEEPFVIQQFVGDPQTQASKTLQALLDEREALGKRGFLIEELLDLADQLTATLEGMHQRQTVVLDGREVETYWAHCDIKPLNVLAVGPPWRYTLIDHDAAVQIASNNQLPRDRAFHSEQWEPPVDEDADALFDVYSLAALLYHAAALVPPPDSLKAALYTEARVRTEREEAEFERFLSLGLGPILTRVLNDSMAPPSFRLRSARNVRQELRRAREAHFLQKALTG